MKLLVVSADARGVDLDTIDLHHLRQGAYLHDLGKLCVPDQILRKPGRLTPEEWAVMQRHVVQGHDLATQIAGLSAHTLGVIRSHHERWDGRGYPDSLAGTNIPLSARIFVVCDVYDALISERPYKNAWSHEAAVSEIEREAGQHFDPDVVRAFLRCGNEQGRSRQRCESWTVMAWKHDRVVFEIDSNSA